MNWKPIPIGYYDRDVLNGKVVLCYDQDDPQTVEAFAVRGTEHGAIFTPSGGLLSLREGGWVPFAWADINVIKRDDEKFPPALTDYLTETKD